MNQAQQRSYSVQDEGQAHKYFTTTCSMIDDIPLTIYERALYKCFKRICGASPDGYCSKSTETLAAMCAMSMGAVSKAKQGLLRKDRPHLNGKALIRLEEIDGRPGRAQHVIKLVDIWPENMAFYTALYERKRTGGIGEESAEEEAQPSLFLPVQTSQQTSPGEVQTSQQTSPGEVKKSIKKSLGEKSEEEQQQPPYPPERTGQIAGDPAAAADLPDGVSEQKAGKRQRLETAGFQVGPADDLLKISAQGDRDTPPVIAGEAAPKRTLRYSAVPDETVQTLLDAGCCRADAEALVAEAKTGAFPWERIAEQIAWLPWNGCESPRYWLPKYIREGWPKPRSLREHEKSQTDAARRQKSGLTRAEEINRQSAEREAAAARRLRYRDGLTPQQAGDLDLEAHDRLLRDGLPGAVGTPQFWRDLLANKGVEGRAFRQARDALRDIIVDERLAEMACGSVPVLDSREAIAA